MDWPARSPDLNPIEHVWVFLGRRLAARTLPPVEDQCGDAYGLTRPQSDQLGFATMWETPWIPPWIPRLN
ncbi:hypothetical protein TNCV_3410011 [Trichonephila clavipes]|nr:hypothetical protein TNCV_3410011 [Trichonephila clavipes]